MIKDQETDVAVERIDDEDEVEYVEVRVTMTPKEAIALTKLILRVETLGEKTQEAQAEANEYGMSLGAKYRPSSGATLKGLEKEEGVLVFKVPSDEAGG